MTKLVILGAVALAGCQSGGIFKGFAPREPVAATVAVSVAGNAVAIGPTTLQTSAMISDARGVMGAVVGLAYDGSVARVIAERPADLPVSCLWVKNEHLGELCIAVSCATSIATGAAPVPRSLAALTVSGCRAGTTQILVAPGSCEEDTCAIAADDGDGDDCLAAADRPITVAGSLACAGGCVADGKVSSTGIEHCVETLLAADECAAGISNCRAADRSEDGGGAIGEFALAIPSEETPR